MAKLIIKEGERKRIYEICEDTLHIGSTPENNIRLRDPAVSRVHCEIKKTPQGYRIIDLESKRGTKVNGEFINQHNLRHGDRIQVGRAIMQFNAGSAVARAGIEPRESVRMERARTRRGLHPMAIVAICVAVVAVLILIVYQVGGMRQYKGLTLLSRVENYKDATERADLETARKLLTEYEALPENEKTPYAEQKYQRLLKEVEEQLVTLRNQDIFENHKKDYYRMSNEAYHLSKKGDYSGALAIADAFEQKYPDSTYLKQWEQKKTKWIKKLQGEIKDMPSSLNAVEKHLENEEFVKANQLLTFVLNRAKNMETRKRARDLDKKLVNTMSLLWKRRHREAQEYAEVGNFRAARDIYTDIKQKFLSKYAKLAEEQLAILKDRE